MTPEADDAGSAATGPVGADLAPARLGRFEALDKRPVNLDGFAERDDEAGLVAFASANDPEPSVALDADGRVTELDGTRPPTSTSSTPSSPRAASTRRWRRRRTGSTTSRSPA